MFGERLRNLRDVGLVPLLSLPPDCPEAVWPDVLLCLLNKCLDELTKELKNCSYKGCFLRDPYGRMQVIQGNDCAQHASL